MDTVKGAHGQTDVNELRSSRPDRGWKGTGEAEQAEYQVWLQIQHRPDNSLCWGSDFALFILS